MMIDEKKKICMGIENTDTDDTQDKRGGLK